MENVNAIQEFVNLIKGVGPDVWAIMIKQQLIYAYIGIVFLIASVVATAIGFIGMLIKDECGEGVYFILTCIGAVCLFFLLILFFTESLPRLMNLEYYAIMDLKS